MYHLVSACIKERDRSRMGAQDQGERWSARLSKNCRRHVRPMLQESQLQNRFSDERLVLNQCTGFWEGFEENNQGNRE